MHIITHRVAATLAAAGIALVTLTAGASSCASNKQIVASCDTRITQQPKFDRVTGSMTASTKSVCNHTPEGHAVTITFWYHPHNAKQFVTMGSYGGADGRCGATPFPGDDARCNARIPGICHVGTWKITVLATGSLQGKPFAFHLTDREEHHIDINTCSKTIRG